MKQSNLISLAADRVLFDIGLQGTESVENPCNPYGITDDFVEFAKSCKIRSGSEYIPFELFDYQIEFAKLLAQHRRIAVFKTRQLGATEEILCWMLFRLLRMSGYLGAVLSIGQDESSKCSQRVQGMPGIVGFRWQTESLKALQAQGCGQLLFRPSTPNAVRSLPSVTDLLFDEADFIKNIEEAYAGATPAQKMAGPNAKTYVVSTMSEKGELGWFWKFFSSGTPESIDIRERMDRVRHGKGDCGGGMDWWIDSEGWLKVLMHWRSHPIYSIVPDYLNKTKREEKLTEAALQREYNLGVPIAGSSLFDPEAIAFCKTGNWDRPRSDRVYLAGIDPNFGGLNSDYFCLLIWDVSVCPYQLVFQYRNNERSNTYHQEKVLEALDAYNPELVAIESNSGGMVILENLVRARSSLRFESVSTSASSKRVNTDRLALALEAGEVAYPEDWQGISEMFNFSALSRKAITGHDDCVTAWAAAWAWLNAVLVVADDQMEKVYG